MSEILEDVSEGEEVTITGAFKEIIRHAKPGFDTVVISVPRDDPEWADARIIYASRPLHQSFRMDNPGFCVLTAEHKWAAQDGKTYTTAELDKDYEIRIVADDEGNVVGSGE